MHTQPRAQPVMISQSVSLSASESATHEYPHHATKTPVAPTSCTHRLSVSLSVSSNCSSENGDEDEAGVEEADGVGHQVPLVVHQ